MSELHNLSAEAAILGAVIYDNQALERVRGTVNATSFAALHNVEIFETVCQLVESGRVADGVTLKAILDQSEALKAAGGAKYLVECMENAAFGPELDDYARLLNDLALRRGLEDAGGLLQGRSRVFRADVTAETLLEDHRRRLDALEGDSGGSRADEWVYAPRAVSETVAHARQEALDGRAPGISTGLKKLDDQMGRLHRGDLILVAGRPSMGKTGVARNIAHSAADCGARVAFFSQEMNIEQLAYRTASAEARRQGHVIPYRDAYNGCASPEDWDILGNVAEHVADTVAYNPSRGLTLSDLRAKARYAKRALGGLDLLVIDYLQIMTPPSKGNREQEVAALSAGLKALAGELDVPVIALSQLSRKPEERSDKRPLMSDLRDSGALEQDADVILFVYRDAYYLEREGGDPQEIQVASRELEINVAKARMGAIGTVHLWYDPTCDLLVNSMQDVAKPRFNHV
ncbi:MAG: replicative DNA helicase [Pseudomonadota bacterium]